MHTLSLETSAEQNTELHQEGLAFIIANIVKAIDPEKVICYGTRTRLAQTWSCFSSSPASTTHTDHDLLIVTKPGDRRKASEILDTIDKYSTGEIRIVATVHALCAVNEALLLGREFFSAIYFNGEMLYDASGVPLAIPAMRESVERLAEVQAHWHRHFGLARKFLDGALYYLNDDSGPLVVFMLHQAMEQTCIAVLKACMDYRTSTHSLSRLLALTENFSPDLSQVFPQNTEEEVVLFKLLVCAYSDARYNEDFSVSMEQAEILCGRVKELQWIGEELYRDKVSLMYCDDFSR
jgi:HEPN domain-containing protein